MNKKISLFILIILTLSLFGSSPTPVDAVTWWDSDWSYKMKITINETKIDADLMDFPVLVYLNSSRIDWAHVQDDLDDLRFVDSTETVQLYAELENYTVNSKAWIWVKIPNIYSMGVPETNQSFYLYYGNDAVSSWWNPEDVWEDSAVMVQHMRDNPDNAHITDSTQYDNDGTKKGADEPIETASGKIDSAQSFDGSDDYMTIADSISIHLGAGNFTITSWIKRNTIDVTHMVLDKRNAAFNTGFWFDVESDNRLYCSVLDGVDSRMINSDIIIGTSWTFITMKCDGNTLYLYINAIEAKTGDITTIGDITTTTILQLGQNVANRQRFNGIIDEVRIYNRALPAAEVKADYNSGADTLLIYGAEELCPLALTVLYNTGIDKLYINGTQRANNTTIYIDKNVNVNATVTLKSNFIFMKYALSSIGASLLPTYIFNMTNPFTLWSYATPNFFIYEEPTTFTFTHWLILLFIALVISLLAAIKFHIIATVSLILVLYMVINVASYAGIILLAIIVWLLTIMFSIIAFAEI